MCLVRKKLRYERRLLRRQHSRSRSCLTCFPSIGRAMRRVTVEPLAFLFILTIYAEYTALQEMIATKLCQQISNATSIHVCDRTTLTPDQRLQLSAQMSGEMMRYMGIFSLCAIPSSLFTGSWSDTLGRKPLLLLPSALGLVAELLFALCSIFLYADSILVLVYVAAIFNGVSGGSTTAMSSCFGYMADISDSERRTRAITILEAAFFVGGFIGFNAAGQLLKHVIGTQFQYIFALCFLLHVCVIGYTLTLRETRGPHRSQSLSQLENVPTAEVVPEKVFSLSHAKRMFRTVSRRRTQRTSILMLYCSGFISFVAMSVQLTLLFTFVKSSPFDWDASRYSLYSGINFLTSGLCLMAVVPLLSRVRPALPDAALGIAGFVSKLLSLLNLGLSQTSTQIFAGIALSAFSEYTMPAIRSMLSKQVDEDERGKAFSFLGVIQNVCQFVGSLVFPAVYRSTLSVAPGAAFVAAGLLQLVPVLLIV